MKKTYKYFPQVAAILALLTPFGIGAFFYLLDFPLISIMVLTICVHIISTIPIQFLLSYMYKWESKKSRLNPSFKKFTHPRIFKHIALAIIYPYMFIFLLFVIRYVNVGKTNDSIYTFISKFHNVLILIIIIIVIIINFSVMLSFLTPFINLKEYLWSKTRSLCFSIYLFLLQKEWFFIFMQKTHKLYFYFTLIINMKSEIYWRFDKRKDFSYRLKIMSFLYNNSKTFVYCLGFIFILELFFFQTIYYFYYFSFFYLILLSLYKLFVLLGRTSFTDEVGLSDYVYKNVKNPRYRSDFTIKLTDPLIFFGFQNSFTKEELQNIHILLKELETEQLRCLTQLKNGSARSLARIRRKLFEKVNTKKYPRNMRIASYYYRSYSIKF